MRDVLQSLVSDHVPLRASPGTAHRTALFADLAGQSGDEAVQACDTSAAGRLLLMLAPVVAA